MAEARTVKGLGLGCVLRVRKHLEMSRINHQIFCTLSRFPTVQKVVEVKPFCFVVYVKNIMKADDAFCDSKHPGLDTLSVLIRTDSEDDDAAAEAVWRLGGDL